MIQTVILQACEASRWLAGEWHNCVFEPVPDLVGVPVFGLIVASMLYMTLYVAGSGNLTTPTVVSILLATALFPVIPDQFSGIAWSILLIGGAGASFQILQKYVLDPSTAT
jgi:hypothetical protein